MKGTRQCRCGRWIVFDEATKTIRHEKPHCEAFDLIMHAAGMKPFKEEWAEVIKLDGSIVKPGSA